MISKGKILFYGLFCRPKLKAPHTEKKLNFLNKLMLLQVRRYKKFGEIPATLSVFEWQESKRRANVHYSILFKCILLYLFCDVLYFINERRDLKAERILEERRRNNLPDYEPYHVFGDNPTYVDHFNDFLSDKL